MQPVRAEVSYRPGTRVAVLCERAWLLADADASAPLVRVSWTLGRRQADIGELLDAIAELGIRQLPSFALAVSGEDAFVVVVRGSGVVSVVTPGGTAEQISAAGVTTWLERRLPLELDSVCLEGPGSQLGPEVPASAGVVLADGVQIRWVSEPVAIDTGASETTPSTGPPTMPPPGYADEPPGQRAPAPTAVTRDLGLADDELIPPVPWLSGGAADSDLEPLPADPPHLPSVEQPADPDPDGESGSGSDSESAEVTLQRGEALRLATASLTIPDGIGPSVHAVLCAAGHLNPPSARRCRTCGEEVVEQEPVTVPRPPLGLLRLSTGDVVTLDRGVVLGRSPQAEGFGPSDRPHVVRVPSPDGDVSRNHVEVRLDGWHVLVVDLRSTNGTVVTIPGERPQRLRGNDPLPIPPGTLVSLANEVSFRYDLAD